MTRATPIAAPASAPEADNAENENDAADAPQGKAKFVETLPPEVVKACDEMTKQLAGIKGGKNGPRLALLGRRAKASLRSLHDGISEFVCPVIVAQVGASKHEVPLHVEAVLHVTVRVGDGEPQAYAIQVGTGYNGPVATNPTSPS